MRVPGRSMIPMWLLLLAGCSDSTSVRLSRSYFLESIDGHTLPTVIGSVTVMRGLITLNTDGTLVTTTHWRQDDAQPAPLEYDQTDTEPYVIHGDSIAFGFLGKCNEACPQRFEGQITKSTLTVTSQAHTPPFFLYQVTTEQPN